MQITATYDELFEQAKQTTSFYLRAGKREIDDLFGTGYAEQHPELLMTFMQVAHGEFKTSSQQKSLQDLNGENL